MTCGSECSQSGCSAEWDLERRSTAIFGNGKSRACHGFEWLEDPKHTAAIIQNRSKVGAKPQRSPGRKDTGRSDPDALDELPEHSRVKVSTTVRTHWQCWFCVSSALVVRSVILRFFSHGVLFVKFLCAPVFVCLKGP